MSKHGLTDSIPSVYVTDLDGANSLLPGLLRIATSQTTSASTSALLPVVRLDEVESTNTTCMQDLRGNLESSWRIVWTDRQTAGRGRQGRTWNSQPGASVCLSVGRHVPAGHQAAPALTVALGAAVVQFLRNMGCPAQLKWPNDILLNGKKLGGILCEASSGGAGAPSLLVAGVGINLRSFSVGQGVADSDAAPSLSAASLEDAGIFHTAESLAPGLAQAVVDVVSAACNAQLLQPWCERAAGMDAWVGQRVSVHERGAVVLEGVSVGIAADGQYAVQTPEGLRQLSVGELSLRAVSERSVSLLVDIGNTRLKWCLADVGDSPQRVSSPLPSTQDTSVTDETVTGHAASPFITAPDFVPSDSHADDVACHALFERMSAVITEHGRSKAGRPDFSPAIADIRIARVGPLEWIERFKAFASARQIPLHVVQSDAGQGAFRNAYANPAQLGVDRYLSALAVAHSFSGRSAVIVSAGTASTIDAVDENACFLGGYILPGPQMMATSLHRNTAQLLQVSSQVSPQSTPFPGSTEQAIAWGILQAQAGAVRSMMSALQEKSGVQPALVLTGGARLWLKPVLENAHEREFLVLEGLARWQPDAGADSPEVV